MIISNNFWTACPIFMKFAVELNDVIASRLAKFERLQGLQMCVCLSVRLSVCLYVCLSVCQYFEST